MINEKVKVLLIEFDLDYSKKIQNCLNLYDKNYFDIIWVRSLKDAQSKIEIHDIKIILLDITSSEYGGLTLFDKVQTINISSIIILICSKNDESIARLAIDRGACDFINKYHIDGEWLHRILKYNLIREKLNEIIRISLSRFKAIVAASPMGIIMSDMLGSIKYSNSAYRKITGYSKEDVLDKLWTFFVHPQDRERVQREWKLPEKIHKSFRHQVRLLHKNGSFIHVRVYGLFLQEEKELHGHIFIFEEIVNVCNDATKNEGSFIPRKKLEDILDKVHDGVMVFDQHGKVTYTNTVAEHIIGQNKERLCRTCFSDVFCFSADFFEFDINKDLNKECEDGFIICSGGRKIPSKFSVEYIFDFGLKRVGVIFIFNILDVVRKLKNHEVYEAQHNVITGLPNELLFEERLSQLIVFSSRKCENFVVIVVDVFLSKNNEVNCDFMDEGDFLKSVSQRIKKLGRKSDIKCHTGRNRFSIALFNIKKLNSVSYFKEKIENLLLRPYSIGEQLIGASVRTGVSIFPKDGNTVTALIRVANESLEKSIFKDRLKGGAFSP